MEKPILMTKVKNAIMKKRNNVSFALRNININGDKRGCSGFIVNDINQTVVYINTEPCGGALKYMYRYADNTKDFTGYHNRWAQSFEELINAVNDLLDKSPAEVNDTRI